MNLSQLNHLSYKLLDLAEVSVRDRAFTERTGVCPFLKYPVHTEIHEFSISCPLHFVYLLFTEPASGSVRRRVIQLLARHALADSDALRGVKRKQHCLPAARVNRALAHDALVRSVMNAFDSA